MSEYPWPDDMIVVTRGTIQEHVPEKKKCFRKVRRLETPEKQTENKNVSEDSNFDSSSYFGTRPSTNYRKNRYNCKKETTQSKNTQQILNGAEKMYANG